jgi:SAM-dependent methyltransferase
MRQLEGLYRDRWRQHGVSPLSLGWTKGKQDIRFDVLLSGLPCEGRSFLDVGCGFGDLNLAIRQRTDRYRYHGMDLLPEFIQEGQRIYGSEQITFAQGDFFSSELAETFDYVLASGVFAFELTEIDNYAYIERMLEKMFANCDEAVSADFLSDRVNFRRAKTFYANPGRVLDIALGLTRNVRLRHDYMPFEFAVTLFKDDRFQERDTIFERYKNAR